MSRDYSTISPSAKMLLLMKGLTRIPFARRAAELISAPAQYDTDMSSRDNVYLFRVLHFEDRYWSIGQLLRPTGITNILELSSGFSFRGLAMAQESNVHYIDTDLPDMIAQKQQLLADLQQDTAPLKGTLELQPLNALDETRFRELAARFPPGPIAIVNEGLLMYLGPAEKEQLARIIHRILSERGGCWITADVYIRVDMPPEVQERMHNDSETKFFEQHHIRDNMFGSFDAARAFFTGIGFTVQAEATQDKDKLSALPAIVQRITPEQLEGLSKMGKIRATWRMVK